MANLNSGSVLYAWLAVLTPRAVAIAPSDQRLDLNEWMHWAAAQMAAENWKTSCKPIVTQYKDRTPAQVAPGPEAKLSSGLSLQACSP